jgi:hypothetical protein
MCFSATANFVGSGFLGAVGVITLTKVKHRRELLFAALSTLFAVHQFIGGVRLAGVGRDPLACGGARYGSGVYPLCTGATPFPAAAKRAAVQA